ncbi:MAG: NuoM family protein [Bacteroidia bacterium]
MLSIDLLFLPLVSSLVVLLLKGNASKLAALILSIMQLALTFFAYFTFKNAGSNLFDYHIALSERPNINFTLGADGVSLLMVILTNLLMPLIILSGFNREQDNPNRLYSLMLLMQFALNGVFLAQDGFIYYIFWELALIPIYFIAFVWGDENRTQVTFKFFIYTLAGSLLMLFGFVYLYLSSPNHSLNWLVLTQNPVCSCNQDWLFWLLFLAFAIKIPIIPFHTWQPDTYASAPTQGTMLLSGIMLKMGTYSLVKWLIPIVPAGFEKWQPVVITLAVIGIVYASVIAIMQRDIKRLFAYSSIAHVGLISAGIFSLTISGLQGSMAQMLAHGINVVGLFLCADIIFNRTKSLEVEGIGGIKAISPSFAAWFLIIVLGSVALPLTNGFIGEFLLLFGVYKYNTWLSVFAGLTIILGAVYMLRMYQKVMLGTPVMENLIFKELYWNEKLVLLVIGLLIFIFGIYPTPILELTEPVLKNLVK